MKTAVIVSTLSIAEVGPLLGFRKLYLRKGSPVDLAQVLLLGVVTQTHKQHHSPPSHTFIWANTSSDYCG